MCFLAGYAGYLCPLDEKGYQEFARQMPNPDIHEAIKAKPCTLLHLLCLLQFNLAGYPGIAQQTKQFSGVCMQLHSPKLV